jgi:hypothetical protein
MPGLQFLSMEYGRKVRLIKMVLENTVNPPNLRKMIMPTVEFNTSCPNHTLLLRQTLSSSGNSIQKGYEMLATFNNVLTLIFPVRCFFA